MDLLSYNFRPNILSTFYEYVDVDQVGYHSLINPCLFPGSHIYQSIADLLVGFPTIVACSSQRLEVSYEEESIVVEIVSM